MWVLRWLSGQSGWWLSRLCYGVAMWLLGYLYVGVRVIDRAGWLVVIRTLLGCCRWLPG